MWKFNIHILLYFIPLIIANVLHMLVVKKDVLKSLRIPLSKRLFGKNKTLRGFVVLPILTACTAGINSLLFGLHAHDTYYYYCLIGFGLGLAYMIGELPNSFIKRRLGIKNGAQSRRYKYLQILVDKSDSLISTLLFYYYVQSVPFRIIVILFFAALLIHISISYLLFLLKIKKSF